MEGDPLKNTRLIPNKHSEILMHNILAWNCLMRNSNLLGMLSSDSSCDRLNTTWEVLIMVILSTLRAFLSVLQILLIMNKDMIVITTSSVLALPGKSLKNVGCDMIRSWYFYVKFGTGRSLNSLKKATKKELYDVQPLVRKLNSLK